MSNFTFNSRESYLAYRRQWKANYAELSAEIRQAKSEMANAFREQHMAKAARLQKELAANREMATRMLLTLAEAKQEAQAQYLKAREAETQQAA